ncbi:MAG: hypothetical protein PHS73_00360 [Candidatus Peribacteraceae bacterium]|nr:hypothetical protein [Candidatus Peribacteraceae bacterium]
MFMLLAGGQVRLDENGKLVLTVKAPQPQTKEVIVDTFRREKVRGDIRTAFVGNPRDAIIEVQIGPRGVHSRTVPPSEGEAPMDPAVRRVMEECAKNLVRAARQVGQVLQN